MKAILRPNTHTNINERQWKWMTVSKTEHEIKKWVNESSVEMCQ